MNNENNRSNSLVPLLIAAGVGALGAFLYQKENREKVKTKLDEVKEKGAVKLAEKVDEVKQKSSEQLGVLQEKLEAGQEMANKEIENAKQRMDNQGQGNKKQNDR